MKEKIVQNCNKLADTLFGHLLIIPRILITAKILTTCATAQKIVSFHPIPCNQKNNHKVRDEARNLPKEEPQASLTRVFVYAKNGSMNKQSNCSEMKPTQNGVTPKK